MEVKSGELQSNRRIQEDWWIPSSFHIHMLLLWEVADNVTIVKALVERAAASDAVKASFGYEDFAMDGWIRLNKKCKSMI